MRSREAHVDVEGEAALTTRRSARRRSYTDGSAAAFETDRINPTTIMDATSEVPPAEMNGRGFPSSARPPMAHPMLRKLERPA